jgi:hypothetical protein
MTPLEIIYAHTFKTNAQAVAEAVIATPPASRALIEEMVVAAMAGVPPPDTLEVVAIPPPGPAGPVPAELLPALAARIRASGDSVTLSKLVRLALHSLACHTAATTLRWVDADAPVDHAAVARLKRLIVNACNRLAMTKYGERYVENQ